MDASRIRFILAASLIFCVMMITAVEAVDHKCLTVYKTWGTERYTSYYSQRYTVGCGWCGWSRCAKYRQVSCDAYRRKLYTNYRYECCPGWRKDRYGSCSMAICNPACRANRGSCVSPNVCRCTGYSGRFCQYDVDECRTTSTNQCSQICINTVGSYRCECNTGYSLQPDGRGCNDIDECSMTRTQDCQHRCVNTPGSYRCECYDGYNLQPNMKECGDNNECARMSSNSCEQICINKPGGFDCTCTMGYNLGTDNDCDDIDECEKETDDCQQICNNTVGSFDCLCQDGYQRGMMDDKMCIDIDECAPPMNCDMIKICEQPGQGSNCTYVGGDVIDIGECVELSGVDACSEVDYNCTELQVCQPTTQGLVCTCIEREGHTLAESENTVVGSLSIFDLSRLRRCETVNGNFSCDLLEDYKLVIDNTFCEDAIKHNCTDMEVCKNTKGGYQCPCKEGYIRNNDTQICNDIDECSTDYMNCPKGEVQICQTGNETILCRCIEGSYRECLVNNNCDVCDGGVRVCRGDDICTCHKQFFLNTDNRPCKGGGCGEMIHDCTEMESCVNTLGGYNCTCVEGYRRKNGPGGNCTDVNECHEETALCNHHCMNTVGNYSCSCVEGFMLAPDNYTCRMRMGIYDAYMALSLEDNLDKPVEMSSALSGSSQGWLFPLGMLCCLAIIIIVVVGRKKSDRFLRGTDVPLNAMRSLHRRITDGRSVTGGQSNVYAPTPTREPGDMESDPINDDAVYTPNIVGQVRGSTRVATVVDEVDVYQVPIASHTVADTPETVPDQSGIDDEPHYLFEEFGAPESRPNNEEQELYENYETRPAAVDREELYLEMIG